MPIGRTAKRRARPSSTSPTEIYPRVSAAGDPTAALAAILKSHDRIGFGRRGVLDAEEEICRFAATLTPSVRDRLDAEILSWLEDATAERVTALLHYNLPEHLQALAIRLCVGLPIAAGAPLLRRLYAEAAFDADEKPLRRAALYDAVTTLNESTDA